MKFELFRGEPLLSLSASPVPLHGAYGCIRFKDLRKMTEDWMYMPVESKEELQKYMAYMKEREGEYKDPRFLPSPQRMS